MSKFDRHKLEGMTTNERLWEVGLFDQFEDAIRARDYQEIRRILRAVYVDEPSIDSIIDRTRNSDAWNAAHGFSDYKRGG